MNKIDFTKHYTHLYRPSTTAFEIVEVPPLHFLMIDGQGDPNTASEYAQALEALYALAYRIKFASKNTLGRDYVVPPLEGLWWATDWASFTTARDKRVWEWTLMILLPDWVSLELYQQVVDDLYHNKPLASLHRIRREHYHEGLAVQILHTGSYDEEGPVLMRLHQEWLPQHGYVENGKHHEIYLNDARRVLPAKLKTVLRQPIRPG